MTTFNYFASLLSPQVALVPYCSFASKLNEEGSLNAFQGQQESLFLAHFSFFSSGPAEVSEVHHQCA